MHKPIYCDNATTTFPKPQPVYDAVCNYLQTIGASPGRSSYGLAIQANSIVFNAREACARLFNIPDSSRIVFTGSATESINIALFGLLNSGDRVAVTAMEHNSVMRPLRSLMKMKNIDVSIIPCDRNGAVNIDAYERNVRNGVKCAIVNHASNVCGTIQPIERLGPIARSNKAFFIVDCAQTAGIVPIDVQKFEIDVLAFSGHKGLYGPQGTGGLYLREGIDCRPLKYGGTGSKSDSDMQPEFFPDKFESGTINGPGIAGLGAGIDFILHKGLSVIRSHGKECTASLLKIMRDGDKRVEIVGPKDPEKIIPIVSFIIKGMDPGAIARTFNDEFGICCRIGLHCAPNAHRSLGTFPLGTIRLSPGFFTTPQEIEAIGKAIKLICK